uniref:Uncharacterized protein n=1 Tax=Tanacetum cinerariifolium TaxID=118510 RepID=A0A6L2NCS0_TANCI|nr:hypothetical protein [Tanacetum cinerariifolium]
MTAMEKSADEFISRLMDKKDKVLMENEDIIARLKRVLEENAASLMKHLAVTIVHSNRKDMLERDHEERIEMIEMLRNMVLTWVGNEVEGLLLVIHEDMIVHLEWHLGEQRVTIQRMIGERTVETCRK